MKNKLSSRLPNR